MKRRSINDDESKSFEDDENGSKLRLFKGDARNNDDGWCNILGGDGEGGHVIADIVNSSASLSNESTADEERASADIFLNQMPNFDGRGRGRRNSNTPKKTKRKSLTLSGTNSNNNSDHPDLSSLIASELTKLSIEDRIKALEEVHGVVENIEEDPEEIDSLFDQVKEELKRLRYKQAYEKAAFLSSTYVNDPEFVLPFLRADNYNPRPAAIRLAEHFKYKLELFGEHTLVRDIMYEDLSEDEKIILKSGFVQTLPASDRAGRQVVVCNMCEFLKVGTLRNCIRAMWYLSMRNSQLMTAVNHCGIVGIYFAHGMGNIFEKLYNRNDFANGTGFMQQALPYKLASVHFCFDNSFGSAIQTYMMMTLGKCARIRLRSHCGSKMECRYALKSFGIDIDTFQIDGSTSLSDSVKEVIERCRELDAAHQKKLDARLLPRPNDVLLGRGRPFQLYSGNLALTSKIDENRTRYTNAKKMHKKIITSEIVESIHASGGRFLKKVNNENGTGADWEEVDFETARLKVSHSFRTMSKWHSENDDTWNNGGSGTEEIVVDSIPSISTGEGSPLGLMAEPTPSTLATDVNNLASSNKRRKG